MAYKKANEIHTSMTQMLSIESSVLMAKVNVHLLVSRQISGGIQVCWCLASNDSHMILLLLDDKIHTDGT